MCECVVATALEVLKYITSDTSRSLGRRLGRLSINRVVHRQHGVEFLEAVASLDTGAAERSRRWFWRRVGRSGARLAGRRDVCTWLRRAELELHQRAVDLLLPDVLRPIPSQLTQVIFTHLDPRVDGDFDQKIMQEGKKTEIQGQSRRHW